MASSQFPFDFEKHEMNLKANVKLAENENVKYT